MASRWLVISARRSMDDGCRSICSRMSVLPVSCMDMAPSWHRCGRQPLLRGGALPDDVDDVPQVLGGCGFTQQQPFEQVLVLLSQHLLIQHLLVWRQRGHALVHKGDQQQVQLQHAPPAVPEEL